MMPFATRRRGREYHSSEEDDKHLHLGLGMWEDHRRHRRHRSHRKRREMGLETNQEHRRRRSNPLERFLE